MKRRILLATPMKTGVDSNYMAGLVPTLLTRFPDIELFPTLLEGPSVNFARNELTHYGRKLGCREMVFIDSDMGWTIEHFIRLISHVDLDIVGGLYCKRRPGAAAWLMNDKPGCEIDEATGLCEVNDVATGFMKIRLDTVMPALEKMFPHLEHFNFTKTPKGEDATSWEFFPMGCEGPRCPAERLERIKAIMQSYDRNSSYDDIDEVTALSAIRAACYDEQPPSTLRGEDYMFCKMARAAGFKVYVDFGMPIVPHMGLVPFPIVPEFVGLDKTGALTVNQNQV